MEQHYKEIEEKMGKTIAAFTSELHAIRAGRANAAVLDKVSVDYYGTATPINQMAAISVAEARVLVIQPWDMSTLKSIEKAIQISDIGINPQNDGKVIRIAFPPLTEDRRKDLVKGIHKHGEDAKIAIRNIRRDAIEVFKAKKKTSEVTEDGLKDAEKHVQDLTDRFCKDIDFLVVKKEKELLEV